MKEKLTNKYLTIEVESKGAELISIESKTNNYEYLWQAKPEIWERHAPVLFPIVGRLKGGIYVLDGKTYSMSQHGFVRDYEFELVDKQEYKLTYKFNSNEETLKIYPFKFEFYIIYELIGSKVVVSYTIKNIDNKKMYFSVGAHPGFNCSLEEGNKMEDYYLEFEENEKAKIALLSDAAGLRTSEKKLLLNNERILCLSHKLFEDGALIFKGLNSSSITLKSKKSDKFVKVSFPGFPYLGIWTKATPTVKAPFICIEPWYGVTDRQEGYADIKEKEGILELEASKIFDASYNIEIG